MTVGGTGSLKSYIIPLVAVVVVAGAVPLVILPGVSGIQEGYAAYQAKQTSLTQLQQKVEDLTKFDLTTNQSDLVTYVEPAIPSEADPSGVLGTMEQVAGQSGVGISSARYTSAASPGTKQSEKGEVRVTLTLSGNYANVAKFIENSEKVSRPASIKALKISTPAVTTGPGAGNLVATVDFISPYLTLPKTLGKADEQLAPYGSAETKALDQVKALARTGFAPTQPQSITGKASPF
jgi:Tfp pilus assembly protein PilO